MTRDEIIVQLSSGNKRITSRAISVVESSDENSIEFLKRIHEKTGSAYRIGITGPPGAGKSTITNQLTKLYRSEGNTVGIIAVDPTSPFTGGALLGDRVRMIEIGNDPGVFIRSMATRGSLGGLSKKAVDAADVLDAAGYDIIIFETVGVGQSELDIAQAADTTMVVLVPESGDSIQAMKAGLMEIADFFVLNKSDRPGADTAVLSIQTILQLKNDRGEWSPKILKAAAQNNTGIQEIADEIKIHKEYQIKNNRLAEKRKKNYKARIKEIVEDKISNILWENSGSLISEDLLSQILNRELSPYSLADKIIKKINFEKL